MNVMQAQPPFFKNLYRKRSFEPEQTTSLDNTLNIQNNFKKKKKVEEHPAILQHKKEINQQYYKLYLLSPNKRVIQKIATSFKYGKNCHKKGIVRIWDEKLHCGSLFDKCVASDQCEELQGQADTPMMTLSQSKQQSLYFPAVHQQILSSTVYVNVSWKDQTSIQEQTLETRLMDKLKQF